MSTFTPSRDSEMIDPRSQPNLNLARGLRILEAFDSERPEWGVRELARALDANPTTIHRLLTTLQNFGYVEHAKTSSRYRLSAKVMRLARRYSEQNPLQEVARRVFEDLSGAFEHSFYLGVLSNFEVVYTAVQDGRGALKISAHVGERIPLHTTAIGKVLLAAQDGAFFERFVRQAPLTERTARSKTTSDALQEEIEEVRRSGFALSLGENFEDIGALGVPLYDARDNVIAGLSLGFPLHLLEAGRLEIEPLLKLARQMSREITYRTEGRLP
ncbi:IclR family transcriptional regulator [Aquibium sp. A9E412]|uniref:IclR family transcriptional regulator n=1 Tax=Aquibium sp. A9E412 TaxID=2976767 RepID=UPI0025B02A5F|nr:IclR family transcriptional regulator [Aquibium sp. A9E412]MDN2567120.1 IclR family transcriptional regulator [Aquibium sp. A9E412]